MKRQNGIYYSLGKQVIKCASALAGILFSCSTSLLSQDNIPQHLFKIYEDNDFINAFGKGTDKAYTNGTRFDYFYTKKSKRHFFTNNIFLHAGKNSCNIYGWAFMQFMYTPNDISAKRIQYNDYPYAGALLVSRSSISCNFQKRISIQTEYKIGVRGHESFAAETQTFIHQIINYQQPMGWGNELHYKLLGNLDVTMEKGIVTRRFVDVIGGSHIAAGNYENGITVYSLFRIGQKAVYFNGLIQQYTAIHKRIQFYFVFKPEVKWQISNAMISGQTEYAVKDQFDENARVIKSRRFQSIQPFVYSLNMGVVLATGHWGISFNQNVSTALLKNLYNHAVGNISLYLTW